MEVIMLISHQKAKAMTIEAIMFKILLFLRMLMAKGMPSKHIISVAKGVAIFA